MRLVRVTVLLAMLVAVLVSMLPGEKAMASPASGGASSASSLTLVSQSPAFVKTQSGVNLGLAIDSKLAASRLSVEVALYSRVLDRYTLRQTLQGSLPGLLTPLGNPGVVPLDLKSLAWVSGGVVSLHLPVSAPDLPGTAGAKGNEGTGGVVLSIFDCAPNCGGVYPLQVSLIDEGVGPVASFTTDLIVTPPSETAGTHAVHFSWVVPLGTAPAISALDHVNPEGSDTSELAALTSALANAPGTGVTLEVFPQFVEALELKKSAAALAELHSLTGPGGEVSLLAGTFTPSDLDALVAGGLPGEATTQLSRGRALLQGAFPYVANEYAAFDPIDSDSLALLQQAGVTRLILPDNGVKALSPSFSQWTPTTPFIIPGSGVEAVASDPGLADDLASTASPALRAQQMLADLTIVYFDNPGAEQAMAVESPPGVAVDTAFADDLLDGLSESPVVHAVTLRNLFDSVSPGSISTSPGQRSLAAGTPSTTDIPSPAAITAAHQGLAALGSIAASDLSPKGEPPLSDLILMSETSSAAPNVRDAYLGAIDSKASLLDNEVSLPLGRTITVTSLQAKIPISIVSTVPTAFQASLTVSSGSGAELGFPHGHTWLVTLYPRTNTVEITLSARTSGDFSLDLRLSTTTGYTLQSGTMTIRSTAISGVAVGLSVGAAGFLGLWWLRSILARRRKKHKLRGAALAASAFPGDQSTVSSPAE